MSIYTKTRAQMQKELGDQSLASTNPLRKIAASQRKSSQMRAAQMILENNMMNRSSNLNNLSEANEAYNDTMHIGSVQQIGSEQHNARARNHSVRPAPLQRIQKEWEANLPNDRSHYAESPVARFQHSSGAFSPDRFMTRTFNRKMKMKDTFTQIFPSYNHEQQTCYLNGKTQSYSHAKHPEYTRDIEGKLVKQIDVRYNHKIDRIKNYSEEMYRLGSFAPQPIKGVAAGKR